MATRKDLLAGLQGVGTGFSKMGQMLMERERMDTQTALDQEEAERKRALAPSQLAASQAGAELAGTQAQEGKVKLSETLVTADKRKQADAANQSLMAENEAAGWQVDPEDQGQVGTWKAELAALNRFRARENKPAMSAAEYVQAKKTEKFERTAKTADEKRKGEAHTDNLKTSAANRVLTFAQADKAAHEAKKPPKASELPIDVRSEVQALSGKNAGKISIANQIDSYLAEFDAAKTEDDKVRIGRQMVKVLNSTEGTDAVGIEEVRRLGDAIEYNIADVKAGLGMKPGKFHGRDLEGFRRQAGATAKAVRGAVDSSRQEVDRIMGRTSASPAPAPAPVEAPAGAPKAGQVEDGYRFKGGDPADPKNWEKT